MLRSRDNFFFKKLYKKKLSFEKKIKSLTTRKVKRRSFWNFVHLFISVTSTFSINFKLAVDFIIEILNVEKNTLFQLRTLFASKQLHIKYRNTSHFIDNSIRYKFSINSWPPKVAMIKCMYRFMYRRGDITKNSKENPIFSCNCW